MKKTAAVFVLTLILVFSMTVSATYFPFRTEDDVITGYITYYDTVEVPDIISEIQSGALYDADISRLIIRSGRCIINYGSLNNETTVVAKKGSLSAVTAESCGYEVEYIQDRYTLTVNYVDSQGTKLIKSYESELIDGASYRVNPVKIRGYETDFVSESGKIDLGDVSVDIVYYPKEDIGGNTSGNSEDDGIRAVVHEYSYYNYDLYTKIIAISTAVAASLIIIILAAGKISEKIRNRK